MLQAAQVAQDALDLGALTHGFEERSPAMIEQAILPALMRGNEVVTAGLPPIILQVMVGAGRAEARTAQRNGTFRSSAPKELRAAQDPFDVSFEATDPEALAWARAHSAQTIVGMNLESREAVRNVVANAFAEGMPPGTAARFIEPLIGLTDSQARAVENLRKRMIENPGKLVRAGKVKIRVPKTGATEALILKRTGEYAGRLLRKRAINIARTETIAASNEGQRRLWLQAASEGLLSLTVARVWIVTPDDALCPICIPMAGVLAPLNEPFVSPETGAEYMGPPAHGSCRCGQGISDRPLPVQETIQ